MFRSEGFAAALSGRRCAARVQDAHRLPGNSVLARCATPVRRGFFRGTARENQPFIRSNVVAMCAVAPDSCVRGALAGLLPGTAMSMAMMLVAMLRGQSIWAMPNLISAMRFGPAVADGAPGLPTRIGVGTHEATSILLGVVAVSFVSGLPRWRVLLVSLAYALASDPLVFSLVLRWANPLMYEQAPMLRMAWAHLLFGVVFAIAYTHLQARQQP